MNVEEGSNEERHHQEVQEGLNDLVRRSLIQLADMDGLTERLHTIGERMSRCTRGGAGDGTGGDGGPGLA